MSAFVIGPGVEHTPQEYEQEIQRLQKQVERQKIHIEALELLQGKNRNTIADLKKQVPRADFFEAIRYDVDCLIQYANMMKGQIDTWEKKASERVPETMSEEHELPE